MIDVATIALTGTGILVAGSVGLIAIGMAKVAGKYDRDTEAMATDAGSRLTPHQIIDNVRKAALRGKISPFPADMLQCIREAERVVPEASASCEICQGTLFADYASFAIVPCPRCIGMAATVEGDESRHQPQPPASSLVLPKLTDDDARELKKRFDQALSDPRYPQSLVAMPEELSRPQVFAGSAIRHTAQALAELTRFNVEGAKNERFPLDEDVEVFLAKALQATINILLAYQPSEHEREELGQLEAALHKFITDYGA